MNKITLYNVISDDGYITGEDGSEDFIPDNNWPLTLSVFEKYEVLMMGRKTYEAIQAYPNELLKPFEDLACRKVVVSHNPVSNLKGGYEYADSPESVVSKYKSMNILASSGPTLNNYLLSNNLVKQIIFHRLPIRIGKGVKPFLDSHLRKLYLQSEIKISDNMLQQMYVIRKMTAIQLILLGLIIMGIILLLTQKFWVDNLVNFILLHSSPY